MNDTDSQAQLASGTGRVIQHFASDSAESILAVAMLALAEFEAAHKDGRVAVMRRSSQVLDTTARLAAVRLGATDPRVLELSSTSLLCAFDVAMTCGARRSALASYEELARLGRRMADALGANARQTMQHDVNAAASLAEYASRYRNTRQLDEAIGLLERSTRRASQVLGEHHSLTRRSRFNLDHARSLLLVEPDTVREAVQDAGAKPLTAKPSSTTKDTVSAMALASQSSNEQRYAEAIQAARSGGTHALDELITELSPMLWRIARRSGLDRASAEDVVQTTWLALIKSLPTIEPSALPGWMARTAKRESWRLTRTQRRESVVDQQWDDILADRPELDDEVADRMGLSPRYQALLRIIGQLSDVCRTLLTVFAYTPRPDYDQVAKTLGIRRGAIGPTRGRCLAELRKQLHSDPEWNH